ncbi:MAG: hypothetical protein KKA64_02045 [Nanoarchaeota archaeon]|nr:hypothetical protein [Nanoarchaeota archaeon]
MTYKKYIEKNGKIYGPYSYHSQRVNGKVVSEYFGKKESFSAGNYKKPALFIFGIFVIAVLIYFGFGIFNQSFSGKAILDLDTTYYENQSLNGVLRLSLKEGELLPADSKIVVKSASGKSYEFQLSELSDESTIEGDYYIEGNSLSGSGAGYGVSGKKLIYAPVSFTLEISSESKSEEKEAKEEVKNETGVAVDEGVSVENVSESEANGTESQNPEAVESAGTNESAGTGEETQVSESAESEVAQGTEAVEEPTENAVEEESSSKEEKAEEKIEKKEEITPETASTETAEETSQEAPVTGGVVTRIFGKVFNLFQGLVSTGKVSMEIKKEVSGEVSGEAPFVYSLEKGQSSSIKTGSVKTKEGEELSDDTIKLTLENEEAIVTTDYSVGEEEGFGEKYLGDIGKRISIDVSKLNVIAEKGELKVSLVYGDNELVSLTTALEVEGAINATTQTNVTEQNISTNMTFNLTGFEAGKLTEEEKAVLLSKFGNESVKITKAEIINGRMVLKYEIGEYWAEFSYEYINSMEEEINKEMENDKVKWLKDLARTLSKEETAVKKVEGLIGDYPI